MFVRPFVGCGGIFSDPKQVLRLSNDGCFALVLVGYYEVFSLHELISGLMKSPNISSFSKC